MPSKLSQALLSDAAPAFFLSYRAAIFKVICLYL